MRIAITGTPGTGKTAVAEALSDLLGLSILSVKELAEEHGLFAGRDAERNAEIVDEEKLGDVALPEDCIVEGLLAHHAAVDGVVVLRCHPDELEERLAAKGWGTDKIQENVEAEAMDLILQEAVSMHEAVYEIDTTERDAADVAQIIKGLLDGDIAEGEYRPGHVDYTGEIQ